MATARTAQSERAILFWRLTEKDGGASRWQPPESFLPEHAAAGRLAQTLPGEPDFVNEHAGFFLPQPAPRRLPAPTRQQIERLGLIGTPRLTRLGQALGPSVDEAVATLTTTRHLKSGQRALANALEANGRVRLPEAVLTLCAELLAERGDRDGAFALLAAPKPPPPPSEPPDIEVDAPLHEGDAAAHDAAATLTALAAIASLDRRGQRLAALAAARTSLADHPDLEVAALMRSVLARLLRGPVVTLVIDGRTQRIAFGDTVTVGRAGATFVLASPLVSRVHLRLQRRAGVAVVEDPGSHNGTWLAGARLTAPLPLGTGIDLTLGREIPCSFHEEEGAVIIDLAGERTLAPLGPLVTGGLRLAYGPRDGETVVTLTAEPGVTASLAGAPIESTIELALGDVVRVAGKTPVELRVIG